MSTINNPFLLVFIWPMFKNISFLKAKKHISPLFYSKKPKVLYIMAAKFRL